MAKRLRELKYDWTRFTLPDFVEWLNTTEKRTFLCVPFEMPPTLFGAWFSTPFNTEFIFYESQTSDVHQAHIVLHELSHYLLEHPCATLTESDLEAIRNDPTGAAARAILKRYIRCRGTVLEDLDEEEAEREREAETLCSLMQEQVVRHARLSELVVRREGVLTAGTYLNALEMR